MENKDFLVDRSHDLISPSKLPDNSLVKLLWHFAITEIESECPTSVPTNGLAKILSNFVATNALWYSLAFWN